LSRDAAGTLRCIEGLDIEVLAIEKYDGKR
jgi:hypothetical protein